MVRTMVNFPTHLSFSLVTTFKGIVQPFELGPVTSRVRSAVKFCEAGHFQKKFLIIQSHERSLKPISAA
jgi:hypothetical protein